MDSNFTLDLLTLHTYAETTPAQKEELAMQIAQDYTLHEELMDMVRTKKALTAKMMSPSATSVRIIMEHSIKSEHLQEI